MNSVHAQSAAAKTSTTQFPNLPLVREADGSEPSASLAWIGVVLLGVAALVLVWKRPVGRRVRKADTAALIVQGATSLTPHASLHVVEWEGERLLVACSPGSVAVIARKSQEPGAQT